MVRRHRRPGRGKVLSGRAPEQLAAMRRAGLVVGRTLEVLRAAVAPGVSTGDLDALAADRLRAEGAVSSFLGYHGFPAVICASVNDEVVHGIPDGRRVLREGDVVGIDLGAVVDGWHGDAAVTVPVGIVAPEVAQLVAVTEAALWAALGEVVPGAALGDLGAAVERVVRPHGYGLVEEFTGHGIGRSMHEEPAVPNLGKPGKGPRLTTGTTLAVEPMTTLGRRAVRVLADDWTVVTKDGSWSAHWEHTVAATDDGPFVLTALDGGAQRLAASGVAAASG